MSPPDRRREHEEQLLGAARERLGKRSYVRLFESAEGSFAPLTIDDAQLAAKKLSRAIDQAKASPATARATATATAKSSTSPQRVSEVVSDFPSRTRES